MTDPARRAPQSAAVSTSADPAVDALVELARAGDRAALEQLIVAARPQLLRYARRHCEAEDVEEAVQDALWILYRQLRGLRRVAAYAGWLFQVVRRACLRYARAAAALARPMPVESLDAMSDQAGVHAPVTDPALCIALADAIAALPEDYRTALLLKDVQGYTAAEMATMLGISSEGAKSRVHRARALVRARLVDVAQ